MTMNQLPYEEYKGFYLAPGITMPAQGIYEYNVYMRVADVAAETPLYTFDSKDRAIEWVDDYVKEYGLVEVTKERITKYEVGLSEFADKLKPYIDDETAAWSDYSRLAVEAEQLGLEDARLFREMAADESRHASYLRGIIDAIKAKIGG